MKTEENGPEGQRGRFAPDNPGGPRRSRREAKRAYVDATFAAVPIETWIEIVARAVNDAKAGDQAALAWLSKSLGLDAPRKAGRTDPDEMTTLCDVLKAAQNATAPPRPSIGPITTPPTRAGSLKPTRRFSI